MKEMDMQLNEMIRQVPIYSLYIDLLTRRLFLQIQTKDEDGGDFGEPYSTTRDMINRLPSKGKVILEMINIYYDGNDEDPILNAKDPAASVFYERPALGGMTKISSFPYPLTESLDEFSEVIDCVLGQHGMSSGLVLTGKTETDVKMAFCATWNVCIRLEHILILYGESATVKEVARGVAKQDE